MAHRGQGPVENPITWTFRRSGFANLVRVEEERTDYLRAPRLYPLLRQVRRTPRSSRLLIDSVETNVGTVRKIPWV